MLCLQKYFSPVLPQVYRTCSVPTATKPYSSPVHEFRSDGLCFNPWYIKQDNSSCAHSSNLLSVGYRSHLFLSLILTLEDQRNSSSPAMPWKPYQHWLTLVQYVKISYQEDIIWPHSTLVCTTQNIRRLTGSFHLRWFLPPPQPRTIKRMTVLAQNNKSLRR